MCTALEWKGGTCKLYHNQKFTKLMHVDMIVFLSYPKSVHIATCSFCRELATIP